MTWACWRAIRQSRGEHASVLGLARQLGETWRTLNEAGPRWVCRREALGASAARETCLPLARAQHLLVVVQVSQELVCGLHLLPQVVNSGAGTARTPMSSSSYAFGHADATTQRRYRELHTLLPPLQGGSGRSLHGSTAARHLVNGL